MTHMYDRGYPADSREAQRLTSLVPFSVLVLAGLAVQAVVAVMQYSAISDDRDYTGGLRHVDPASIDIGHLQHLDHRVTSLSHTLIGGYVVTGILVMIWSYVARRNTDRRSEYGPARSSAWAVWGWICPVVTLWFPFQIVRDIARAQLEVIRGPEADRRIWWARVWWLAMLVTIGGGLAVRATEANSAYDLDTAISEELSHFKADHFFTGALIVAAVLFAAVVIQLTIWNEQMRRVPVPAPRPPVAYGYGPPVYEQSGPGLSQPAPNYPPPLGPDGQAR